MYAPGTTRLPSLGSRCTKLLYKKIMAPARRGCLIHNESLRVWISYSSAVIKNCTISNLYAARKKRYFGNSKVSFFKLFLHSLKILSVFQLKIALNTAIIILLLFLLGNFLNYVILKMIIFLLIIINFLIICIRFSFL